MFKNDLAVIESTKTWFKSSLGCSVGKQEFLNNRYLFHIVHTKEDILKGYEIFLSKLLNYEATACLFIVPEIELINENRIETVIKYLANIFCVLNGSNPDTIVNGGALNLNISVQCPVTNEMVMFYDFDAIAFCPQSSNDSEELYDPLMSAPFPCVNITSDIFVFSLFANEFSLRKTNKNLRELSKFDRDILYKNILATWQNMAEMSIKNYIKITDTKKCPVYFSEDKSFWFANHQDPAFAELKKELYKHEMPKIYVPNIFKEWEIYFETGKIPKFDNTSKAGY